MNPTSDNRMKHNIYISPVIVRVYAWLNKIYLAKSKIFCLKTTTALQSLNKTTRPSPSYRHLLSSEFGCCQQRFLFFFKNVMAVGKSIKFGTQDRSNGGDRLRAAYRGVRQGRGRSTSVLCFSFFQTLSNPARDTDGTSFALGRAVRGCICHRP